MAFTSFDGAHLIKTVRWGIFGTDRVSRDFATALCATPAACIAAVAADFDMPLPLEGYDSLAACDEVSLAYIGTPHAMHAENALAMRAGGEGVRAQAEPGPTGVDLQTMSTLRHAGGRVIATPCLGNGCVHEAIAPALLERRLDEVTVP